MLKHYLETEYHIVQSIYFLWSIPLKRRNYWKKLYSFPGYLIHYRFIVNTITNVSYFFDHHHHDRKKLLYKNHLKIVWTWNYLLLIIFFLNLTILILKRMCYAWQWKIRRSIFWSLTTKVMLFFFIILYDHRKLIKEAYYKARM